MAEAARSPHLKDELFSLSGTIARRTHEKAKYEREVKKSPGRNHFGLPGVRRQLSYFLETADWSALHDLHFQQTVWVGLNLVKLGLVDLFVVLL